MRGRVMFPIRDVRGRVIGFGGRAILADQQPKYINTPETPIFKKRSALYGFPHALESIRRADQVIVCEGYFDRIALERANLGEALATCGTALTHGHGEQISRRTKQVVLLFDGDEAGQNAVEKAVSELLPIGLSLRAAFLPAGEDPDSVLAASGAQALRDLVQECPDALEFVMQRALRKGYATPEQKSSAVAKVAPYIALVPDSVKRFAYCRRLAIATGTVEEAVTKVVGRIAENNRLRRPASDGIEAIALVASPRAGGRAERHLYQLTEILFLHPRLFSADVQNAIERHVEDDSWRSLLRLLADAASEGCLDRDGSIDLYRLGDRLSEENAKRLNAIAVDDLLVESETAPEKMLEEVLGWFDKRRRKAAEESLTRQLHDPAADHEALILEKQRQLEEKSSRRTENDPYDPMT